MNMPTSIAARRSEWCINMAGGVIFVPPEQFTRLWPRSGMTLRVAHSDCDPKKRSSPLGSVAVIQWHRTYLHSALAYHLGYLTASATTARPFRDHVPYRFGS